MQEHIYIYTNSWGQEVQQEGGRVTHFLQIYTAEAATAAAADVGCRAGSVSLMPCLRALA